MDVSRVLRGQLAVFGVVIEDLVHVVVCLELCAFHDSLFHHLRGLVVGQVLVLVRSGLGRRRERGALATRGEAHAFVTTGALAWLLHGFLRCGLGRRGLSARPGLGLVGMLLAAVRGPVQRRPLAGANWLAAARQQASLGIRDPAPPPPRHGAVRARLGSWSWRWRWTRCGAAGRRPRRPRRA